MGKDDFYDIAYSEPPEGFRTPQFIGLARVIFIFIFPFLVLTYGHVLVEAKLEKIRIDTTAKRYEEVATRARADEAQIHLRDKQEFIYYLSHEMRNALNVIVANIDYYLAEDVTKNNKLESGKKQDEAKEVVIPREVIEDISFAAKIASRVVGDVLTLETMGKSLSLDISPFSVEDTVRKSLRSFEKKSLEKKIKLTVTQEGAAIPSLMGDSERLGQVLANFVSNALKFTSEEGEIDVKFGMRNDELYIAVTDNGIGISKAEQLTLFQAFRQLRPGQLNGEGTGLGLAICKKIVNLHGGDVGVDSEEGKGSTFWLTIKAVKGEYSEVAQIAAADNDLSVEQSYSAKSVLVVEDSLVLARVLVRMITKLGVKNVKHVGDGIEAVAAITRGDPYDLILMDHEMPILNGSDATREIRSLGFRGKIIGLTGNASEEQQNAFLEAGLDGVVSKPVSSNMLGSVLRKNLCKEEGIG